MTPEAVRAEVAVAVAGTAEVALVAAVQAAVAMVMVASEA